MALSVHSFTATRQRVRRLCSPRVSGARGIMVNRSRGTTFLAGMIVFGACWARAQTPPLRDQSVAQKPLAPLSATSPLVRDGLFGIDVVVTDAAGNPVSDLSAMGFHSPR